MANPHLGLGLAPPPAADPAAAPPPRRAPRLAKRRHAATSSRSRPQPSSAAPWNPFSGGGTDGSRQGENGGLGSVDGGGVGGGGFGLRKGQSGGFVFGAAPAVSQQPPQPAAASSNDAPFVFGSVRDSLPRFDEGWSATPKLHDMMRKPNLWSPGKDGIGVGKGVGHKDGSSNFGVDMPTLVSNSEANVLPEKLTQLNIGSRAPLQNGSANGAPKVFVLGSNGAGSFADSRNTATSDADSCASSSVHGTEANGMPEKLTQFSIGNQTPCGRMGSEATNGAPTVFMFGSSTESGHPYSTNDVASGADTNSSSTVNGTDDASVLPEKISRLNAGSGMSFQHIKSGGGGSHQAEEFVFGSGRTECTLFGKAASNTSYKGSDFFSAVNSNASSSANGAVNLPVEKTSDLNVGGGFMQSMKSDSANFPPEAFVFGKNESTSSVSGLSASIVMDDGGNFVTGANTNACTSAHVTVESTLPEKMTKLNIGHVIPSQSMKDEAATRPPEVVVFGSNATSSFFSAQTPSTPFTSYQTNVSSEPEDIRNSTYSRSNNDKGYGPSDFVFGSTNNATAQSEGAAEHALQDEIKKLNISREGPSTGCNKVNDSSTPEFSFQSKAESTSRYGAIPQPKVEESGPFTSSNHSSSFPTSENAMPSFSSRTMNAGGETVPGESCAVKQDPSWCSRESLFGIDYIKSAYRDKKEAHKSTRKKKRPTRLKQCAQLHQVVSQETRTNGLGSDSAGDYSPMDYSPYPAAVEQVSREASVNSDQSVHMCDSSVSNQNSSCAEEDLVSLSATEHLVIDADLPTYEEEGRVPNVDTFENNFANSFSSFDEVNLCNVNVGTNGEPKSYTAEACFDGYGYNVDRQTCEENTYRTQHEYGEPVTFQSSSVKFSGLNFSFGASLSPQSSLSTQRRNTRRKLRTKGGQVSKPSATQAFVQPKASHDTKGVRSFPETSKTENSMKEQSAIDASISAALETCETWRTSGNQAYANGHFATAEEYYTRGINSIFHHGTSGRCSRALMLCYSNRAATRMSLGRMREALQDCLVATSIDPTFLKAKVRAANCQLALGDLEDASRSYTACLKSNNTAGSDFKMFAEASDGLERVKRVEDWISQSKGLLKKRTMPEAITALELISNALHISSHSDNLMEMKAEALLTLRRYEEVIELCQETVDLAEINSVLFNGESKNSNVSEVTECPGRFWRSYFICKSYFLLGKLEDAIDLLKKHEQLTPVKESDGRISQEHFSSLSTTISQLLSLKAAGNESFQARRFSQAVERYSAALACNSDSRPFSALCFCNRAAAYQALGQVTDAIADCSLAMVLDANYPKAISRRATLYEMIRDYGQAANDLRKLISLLEKQANKSGVSPKVLNKHSDLKQARARLLSVEEEAKNDTSLNLYLILGVEPSCSPADIKKAYRKAALRHHPDKAQLLVRNENADDGFWRDVAKEVYADADHLFKTIGEANNVLSDPDKRQEYDIEENLRNATARVYKGRSPHRSPEQHHRKQYGRGFSPRQWQSNKGASHSRWSGYSDDYW